MGSVLSKVMRAATYVVVSVGIRILLKSDQGSVGSNEAEADVEHIYFQDVEEGSATIAQAGGNESSSITMDLDRKLSATEDDSTSISTDSSCPLITRALPSGHNFGPKKGGDSASVVSSSLFTRKSQRDGDDGTTSLEDGVNELFIACHRGETGVVRLILQRGGIDVNKATENSGETFSRRIGLENIWVDGMTPLYIACLEGHVQIVQQLLAIDGIDIHKANANGITPLYAACLKGHGQIVQQLLARPDIHESVNKQDNYGRTPLFTACDGGHEQIVQQLLVRPDINESVNLEDYWGRTPLSIASQKGHSNIVQMIEEHKKKSSKKCIIQ